MVVNTLNNRFNGLVHTTMVDVAVLLQELCTFLFYFTLSPISYRNTPRSNRKQSVQHERPPWRTVITAPVDKKVNKNALLKAKLLDATRRALLAQRICHVGTQTDTVVILREKAIGVQKDLIRMVDKCEDTDGTITIRRDRPGGCKNKT